MDGIKSTPRTLLFCLVLAALTLAAYWAVLHHDFINLDDPDYVTQNPHVQGGLTWENARWAFQAGYASNWHPLTWLSHMLDVQLFGLKPAGHHATNLLLHLANTLLLFLLLRRMTGEDWRSGFVAALFALHPLHVESVAWVAERKDVLSTFFFLLTLWAYARYRKAEGGGEETKGPKDQGTKGPRDQGTGTEKARSEESEGGRGTLNIQHSTLNGEHRTAKGTAENSPSPRPSPPGRGGGLRPSARWYLLALVLFALGLMSKPMLVTLPFVLLLLDYWPLGQLAAPKRSEGGFVAPKRSEGGLRLSTLSSHLSTKVPFLALALASSVITLIAQQRGAAVASLETVPWELRLENALVSYVVYLRQMVWPSSQAVYYPLPDAIPGAQVLLAALVLVLVSALAVTCRRRHPYVLFGWLWYLLMLLPVIGIIKVGLQARADRYTYLPLVGIFIALTWAGAEAAQRLRYGRLLSATAGSAALAGCLVLTLAQVRLWQDSETLYRHTLAVTANNPVIHLNLGSALVEQRRFEEAAGQFAEAVRLKPRYAEALSDWGFALALQGKMDEAIARYRAALAVKPRMDRTHFILANALAQQGKRPEAMAEYRAAININPDSPAALNDLAWALATDPDPQRRNGAEAVNLAERACRVTNFREPLFVGTLAAAYAEAGRFAEAVRAGEKAKALAQAAGQKELTAKNEELLGLYRTGKAYHEGQH